MGYYKHWHLNSGKKWTISGFFFYSVKRGKYLCLSYARIKWWIRANGSALYLTHTYCSTYSISHWMCGSINDDIVDRSQKSLYTKWLAIVNLYLLTYYLTYFWSLIFTSWPRCLSIFSIFDPVNVSINAENLYSITLQAPIFFLKLSSARTITSGPLRRNQNSEVAGSMWVQTALQSHRVKDICSNVFWIQNRVCRKVF